MASPQPTTAVYFYVSDAADEREEPVRVEHPDVLRRRSLKFRKLIDDLAAGIITKITLRLDSTSGIDRPAVKYVLENLQKEAAELNDAGQLETLARHCAVLLQYHCIPDPFCELWESTRPHSSQSSISSGDRQSNTSLQETPRCWRGERSITACGHLITVATMLGLQEILEEEIRVAVWGSDTEVKIPICSVDIKSMRQEELGNLFNKLHEELDVHKDGNQKLVREIRRTLIVNGLGDLSRTQKTNAKVLGNLTPVKFLRRIEIVMTGLLEPQTPIPIGTANKPQARGKAVPPLNLKNLRAKFRKTVINGVEPNEDTIRSILNNLEDFIEARQRDVARLLMETRNATIEEWKEQLDDPGARRRTSRA